MGNGSVFTRSYTFILHKTPYNVTISAFICNNIIIVFLEYEVCVFVIVTNSD